MGNNPMVGATVAVAVSVEEAARAGKFQAFCFWFMPEALIQKDFRKNVGKDGYK